MKVSVLSAVHNEEAFLREMLSSLHAQTHRNWELILVSDGSTDRTMDIVQKACLEDSRVKAAGTGEKVGKAAAFNRAYDASSGDIIVLLAGDDTLPPSSLETRVNALAGIDPATTCAVGFFKFRVMSDNPRVDGIILPRGHATSRSGGVFAMSRALAQIIFPVDERLISEDIWLSHASEALADTVREDPTIVLNYRIHSGNSNPRQRPFPEMSEAMAARHEAWRLLTESDRLQLPPSTKKRLQDLYSAELLRRRGRPLDLLFLKNLPFPDRAAMAAMSTPSLYRVRTLLDRYLSGRRRR